jgi:hypothetical protein
MSLDVSVTDGSHASVAVAWANDGTAGQLIVVGPGRVAMTGAVLSSTVNVFVAVPAFPQSSVAVKVTVTVSLQLPAGGI